MSEPLPIRLGNRGHPRLSGTCRVRPLKPSMDSTRVRVQFAGRARGFGSYGLELRRTSRAEKARA